MRQGFDRGVIVGIVLLAAGMVAIALTSYINIRTIRNDAGKAAHSREVLDAIGTVRTDVRKMQAEQRSYLITGFEDWVSPFVEAAAALRADTDHLVGLTTDDPEQSDKAVSARHEVESGIDRLSNVVKVRGEKNGYDAVLALSRERGRRSFVDPLLNTLTQMDQVERDRLAVREAKAHTAYTRSVFYGIAAAFMGLLAVGVFALLLRHSVRSRAQVTSSLDEQRVLLTATLASIGDAVIATDAAGKITFLNSVAKKLTGWTAEDANGMPLNQVFRIVNETSRSPVENPALRALQEGAVVGLANHTILISKDGREWPIDDSAAPITSGGKIRGAVLVFRDITEKKQAESALRVREERYRLLVNAISDVAYLMSADWSEMQPLDGRNLVASNSGPIRGWMEKNLPQFEHARVRETISTAIAGKKVFEMEHQVIRADGELGWTLSRAVPILSATGEIVEWFGTARDITEQKRAENELRDIRSRMEVALAAAAIGTWAWEVKSDRIFGDQSIGRIFGLPTDNANGVPFSTVIAAIHPDDREGVVGLINKALESGSRYEADYRVVQSDGSWRWVTARGQVERDSVGRPVRFPGVVIDVTDQKRTQEDLARLTAESERRKRLYETILSTIPDFVYVFSLDHRFAYANDALLKMWGRGADQAFGKTLLEIGYEPWHAEMHEREIEQVRESKKPIRGEVPFDGTNGRRIYDYIFVPVIGSDGEVEAVAGTTRDVTDRKAMEDDLREADRKKDDFIALLAHELRNPLAPLRNGLQVLRLAVDKRSMDRAREMMDRQLSHMVRLIDDLLDVSRISRNKMELRRERVLLSDVLNAAVETARPLIDQSGHKLVISLPPENCLLFADLTRLSQVFSNLLTNSAKYTESGGEIWITGQFVGQKIAVSVRDTGIGIPAEALDRVFDMFSQLNRSIDRSAGGLGLGLALVKGLVEMHGGNVTAASAGEGHGSTFTVLLPILTDRKVANVVPARSDDAKNHVRRILAVDDQQDGAESLAMMLRLLGNDVRIALDGVEAVQQAEAFRPDIILMDLGMPILNGLEATRRIREQDWGREIRIIALTGWGQDHDRERSREAGCDEHLVKPVDLLDLQKMLDKRVG